MARRGAVAALIPMTNEHDSNGIMSERFERRLTEECGRMRVEMADGFGQLRTEMAQLRGELKEDMADLRGELKEDMAALRGEMRADMSDLRGEMVRGNTAMLKWLLLFFVSQTAALAAIIRLFVN
jgi:hypothetical protein